MKFGCKAVADCEPAISLMAKHVTQLADLAVKGCFDYLRLYASINLPMENLAKS